MLSRPYLAHAAIFAAGLLVSFLAARPLWQHTAVLVDHLGSGSWEVMTDRAAVEQIVRAKYGDTPAWAISFASASGASFPLDTAFRRDTLTQLGQQTLAESATLRFNATSLQTAYGGLLAQTLLERASPAAPQDASLLRRLADSLRDPGTQARPAPDPTLYERAQAILSSLPRTDVLTQALKQYEEFSQSRSPDFPAFDVAAIPSDDAPGAWDAGAQTLPQLGKCKAAVAALNDVTNGIEANVAILPRLLEVAIERPWLSDALLDRAQAGAPAVYRTYFGEGGELRLIPARLWILMPEDARIEPADEAGGARIRAWARDGSCCRVTCSGDIIDLGSGSLRTNKDGSYTMRRVDRTPLLYAIVSRRRATR